MLPEQAPLWPGPLARLLPARRPNTHTLGNFEHGWQEVAML